MDFLNHPMILLIALAFESAVGYPDSVYARIGHPVSWMGRLITVLDYRLNREDADPVQRRWAGVIALVVLVGVTLAATVAFDVLVWQIAVVGVPATILAFATLTAQRSLHDHVAAVPAALRREGLEGGRRAVSLIVGRNTAVLDEAGVCRAAVESLAENFSDGVVAPTFWILVGGIEGGAVYKAINTADSMIGHKTPRHKAFGWASARLDDLVNLPASRLAALALVIAAAVTPRASALAAIRTTLRDAGHHRSPNAGWPEAAMAGALGFALAGPRMYGNVLVEDHHMGDGNPDLTPDDVDRALALYQRACLVLWASLVLVALIVL